MEEEVIVILLDLTLQSCILSEYSTLSKIN